MARQGGSQYQARRAVFRAECEAADTPCWICGQPIAWDEPDGTTDDAFELDHYHPVSTHPHLELDPANFRPSNRICNRSRGSGAPTPLIDNTSRNWNKPPASPQGVTP